MDWSRSADREKNDNGVTRPAELFPQVFKRLNPFAALLLHLGRASCAIAAAVIVTCLSSALMSQAAYAATPNFDATCGTPGGCHIKPPEGARINAAPLNSGASGTDAADALLFLGDAVTRHGMVAGNATIISELQAFFNVTPQSQNVVYGGSANITVGSLVQDASAPLVTGLTTKGVSNGGASLGSLGSSVSTSSFNVTYSHTASASGQCGNNLDSFRLYGTDGVASNPTPSRQIKINVTAPTFTASSTTKNGVTYSTSATSFSIGVSPTAALNTLTVGTASEGTATATGNLSFNYSASATPVSATVTIPVTINSQTCGTLNATVTLNITPQVISAASVTGTQGSAFSYQIASIPQATGFSMSAADQTTLAGVGLSFSSVTGQITGTPTVAGSAFNVTVNATTSSGNVNRSVAITILSGGTSTLTGPNTATGATITGANAVTGTAGTALNIAYTASNPTINSVNASGLPGGLSFGITNAATGAVAITGTPSQSQNSGNSNVFTVTLNATNGSGIGPNKSLTLTINPSVKATLTNASLTPSQNVSFNYDFLANNVTNIANSAALTFTASGMPAGLSINASTGVISGTATSSGGPTTATVTATNAAGATNASVTFNITPTTVPSISSPTAISGTIGTAITPVSIVATNPPVTSYGGSGLPPGITVSAAGLISGTPTSVGTFNATLTANNAAGPGTLIVPFVISAVPAVASAGTMTVPLNTPTTVDLAAFITGTGITGVQIRSNPAHGQLTVNGTSVTYTPANNYFGSDSFTYVAFGTSGTSAPASVAVTVTGRPNPTQDATVMGTVNNQIDTVRRFSSSQAFNFQRRMETLHRGGGAPGSGAPVQQTRTDGDDNERATPVAAAPASTPAAVATGATLAAMASDNSSVKLRPSGQTLDPVTGMPVNNTLPFTQVRVAGLAPPADAGNPATGTLAALGKISPQAAGLLNPIASFATNRTLNLASLNSTVGGDTAPTLGATSFWIGGDARFGTRDPQNGSPGGTNFRTDGISAGVDRRFTDKLVVGVGLGFGHDKASIGTDGSQSTATGTSGAIYASYQLNDKTYIDGLIGYGVTSMNSSRFVSPLTSYAASHRTANQIFGSVAASYEIRKYDMLFAPYGRLDFTVNKLNQTSETGVGNYGLTYMDQTDRTLRASLGVRAESAHESDWGIVRPRMRAEFQHGFQNGGSSQFAYNDQIGGPNYVVNSNVTDRNAIVAGVGGTLEMRNGLKLGLDYQIMRSFAQETSQGVRVTLEKELDGKRSFTSLLPNLDSSRPALGIRLDGGYMYDRNVSRGRDSGEKFSDQSYTLEANKGWIFPLTEHTRAIVALTGGAEKFHNYEGLSRLYATFRGEVQYRSTGSFGAPTYALFVRATGEAFESYLRDGYRTAFGFSVLKPVTDRITVFGAVTHTDREANSAVFTNHDNSVRLNVDYAVNANSTLYLTGEYRRGDAVSSGLPSLQSLDIAKVFARDDAFNDQLFAYRFEARSFITTIGYNLPFGSRDALDFSFRHVYSVSTDASVVYGKSRYYTDQVSVTYLMRF